MGAPLVGCEAVSGLRRLGGSRAAAAQQQQRCRQRSGASAAAGPPEGGSAACEQRQQQLAADVQQLMLPLLQRVGRAAATAAAAAVLALGALPPGPAQAVLANPRAPVPRTADVALRRSIPAFNADVAEVQERLEAVGFKLRIPQRKPWKAMGDDVAAAAALVADSERMLSGVLPADLPEAEQLMADVRVTLDRLVRAIDIKNPERTAIRVANALEQVASLELLQAPGLPYQLPRAVAGYAALAGRAVVELTVEKAGGEAAFIDPNSSGGPQKRATLRLTLDGYSAPITAANFLLNAQAGVYNNAPLAVSPTAVFAGTAPPGSGGDADTATFDDSPGTAAAADPAAGGRAGRGAPAALPLEILPAGDFEPVYRSTLDVRNGELPVLPLSIYGAVAMGRLPDAGASGYVSGEQFFIFKFERQQAGLAGLSFDEGEFGTFGYITKGLDAVAKLDSGDRIVKAEVVSGLDRLVRP